MRRPDHHPGEELLIDYASGALDEAQALVLATHLALCPDCREHVARLEALGGAFLDAMEPEPVAAGSLEAIFARLDEPEPKPRSIPHCRPARASGSTLLPQPLRGYVGDLDRLAWQTPMPGVATADLFTQGGTKVSLYRLKGGAQTPRHTHGGAELTLVLEGGYSDEHGHYLRGDMAAGDESLTHAPVADPEGCLCVAAVTGGLRLAGPIGLLLNPFLKR